MAPCYIMEGHHVFRDPGDGDVLGGMAFLRLDLGIHNRPSLHWESRPLVATQFAV